MALDIRALLQTGQSSTIQANSHLPNGFPPPPALSLGETFSFDYFPHLFNRVIFSPSLLSLFPISCRGTGRALVLHADRAVHVTEGQVKWEGHVMYLVLHLRSFIYLWVSLRPHLTHEETEPGLKRHDYSPPSVFGGSLAW